MASPPVSQEARVGIAIRHIGRAALVAGGAVVTTLAAEVMAARNHRFLPSDPALEINCALGPEEGESLVLVVLGDSSVAGVGADCAEDTLTYGVAAALAERYRVRLYSLGASGARLHHVVSEQVPRLAELDPDVVLVCVGTNDITHVTPVHEVRRQLKSLGTGLVTAAPRAVVLVSGLPPAETSLAFRWPLRDLLGVWARAYTRLFQGELGRHGITVIDVATVARSAFRGKREMFSPDLFHPSSAGYTFLGRFYGQAVRRALEASRGAGTATPPDLAGDLAG
jgi:lysophospholipase L1-like esterase